MALAALAVAPSPAAVAAPPGPPGLSYTITPAGTPALRFAAQERGTVSGRVRLRNLSAKSRTVRLSPTDLRTANTGGAIFPDGRATKTGTWLQLDRRTVHLPPRGAVTVGFSASVPKAAARGEHYAGIVATDAAEARAAAAPAKRAGVTVRRLTRLALPVRLTTPGALAAHLSLGALGFKSDAAGARLDIGMRNDGNRIIRDTALDLKVSQKGRRMLAIKHTITDFIPGTSIAFPAAWNGQLSRGEYRVTGVIRPQGAPPVRVDETVSFTPKLAKELKRQTGTAAAPAGGGTSLLVWAGLAAAMGAAGLMTVAYLRLRRRLKSVSGS